MKKKSIESKRNHFIFSSVIQMKIQSFLNPKQCKKSLPFFDNLNDNQTEARFLYLIKATSDWEPIYNYLSFTNNKMYNAITVLSYKLLILLSCLFNLLHRRNLFFSYICYLEIITQAYINIIKLALPRFKC